MKRADLPTLVLEALESLGGKGSIVQIARFIWTQYEQELRQSGHLFYSWQYDMRWAGQQLRDTGKLVQAAKSPRGIWIITDHKLL